MKDILTSPRIEDMKRKARARRIRLSLLVFILVLSIVYASGYFSSNTRVTINKIIVTGTRIINSSDVEDIINENISGKYLKLFTKRNIFIYPKKYIYNNLIKNFTRIDKLSIYRDNLNTLHVDISERSGTALYCGASVPEVDLDVGENCYFINDDGYIFDKAPYFSGNIYFKYYAPVVEKTDIMGQQILPKETFHSYVRFIEGITRFKLKPNYLVIEKDGTSTLYLDHDPLATSPKIIFNNDFHLEKILDNLSLSMSKDSFASEIYSKYTSLLYIDMRFKNKVLYKFQ